MGIEEEIEPAKYDELEAEKRWKNREKHSRMTICVDFDGVAHQYVSGWQGEDVAADPPVEGALDWLRMMIDEWFKVVIFSSRSRTPQGIETMKKWFLEHGLEPMYLARLEFPEKKPNAFLIIDDRAFHFQGTFPTPEFIRNFKPWNKK